jgi:DNA polymerase-3 subunit gamma/tau
MPQVGRYSIYIIDEVHMLSQAAFNAFLKTLEEPPAHAIFILATTEKHKILPTILSRCQIFDFNRIRVDDIVGYLSQVAQKEAIQFEEEALNVIAIKADGAMRDALSIFDQVAGFSNNNITYREVIDNLNVLDYEYYFKMTESFLGGQTAHVLLLYNTILLRGFDGLNFMGGLSSHFRDLLVCKDESTLPLLEVSDLLKAKYRQQALACSDSFLFSALEICDQCEVTFKANRNQRLHVELSLIRLCNITDEKKKLIQEQNNLIIPDLPRQSDKSKPIQPAPAGKPLHTEAPARLKEQEQAYTPLANVSIKEALNSIGMDRSAEDLSVDEPYENLDLNPENDALKPVSMEQLLICWDAFADKIRVDKPRMAVTFKNVRPIIVDNHVVTIELNNTAQLEDFNRNIRNDLEKFLGQEMNRNGILLEVRLVQAESEQRGKLYTSEEKFRYLSEKNPVLQAFRQKLNLELE